MFAIVLVVIVATVAARTPADQCTSLDSVTVAISNYRNQSGYLISQVVVEGNEDRGAGLEAWHQSGCCKLQVEHRPVICHSGETRADIVLTFSVAPVTKSNMQAWITRPISPEKAHNILPETASPSPSPPAKVLTTPPVGYVTLQGVGHYKYHGAALSWSAARYACRKEGGDLVNLDTAQKFNFVKGLGGGWTWIGLNERGVNGVYYTVLDAVWVQPDFLKWYPGQPNFPGGADCILLLMADGRLGDNPCEPNKNHYLCEIPWES